MFCSDVSMAAGGSTTTVGKLKKWGNPQVKKLLILFQRPMRKIELNQKKGNKVYLGYQAEATPWIYL